MNKIPIINCHTHVFTADHVPPNLAKTYIPWPFYYLLHLGFIVSLFRFWYKYPARLRHTVGYKKIIKARTKAKAVLLKIHPFNRLFTILLFIFSFFILYSLLLPVFPPDESWISSWIHKGYLIVAPYINFIATWMKLFIIILVLLFFSTVRNMLFAVARLLYKVIAKLPGPQTRDLLRRYLNIGRYAFHHKQSTTLSQLRAQYPKSTGFIVLPMDMEYMGAGPCKTRYRDQMEELKEIKAANKNTFFPFVFADPRRMVDAPDEINYRPGDKPYFKWHLKDDKIVLDECFIKDYIEDFHFSGIKIYPALGYYPFDEKLLPLWKYCADNAIPVLTHCIRGTIFFRGIKKGEWNTHPVFVQAMEKQKGEELDRDGFGDDEDMEEEALTRYEPLVLSQFKNVDFSYNFTHPMNYLCLLDEERLRELISFFMAKNPASPIAGLFGYTARNAPLTHNLSQLKICFGHFGGDDEWARYFEKDRYNYSSQLAKNPTTGIRFFKTLKNEDAPGKPEQLWHNTDWYSIICSMMLQYTQVYADISYILHGDSDILPLLKQTLQNPLLKYKVLYGTDFFVVRNHKSDKHMLADMTGGLSEADFDLIARYNPRTYLRNKLPD